MSIKTILVNIFSFILLLLSGYRGMSSEDLGVKIVCFAFALFLSLTLFHSLWSSIFWKKYILRNRKDKLNLFFNRAVQLKRQRNSWNLTTTCFFMFSSYALSFVLLYSFFDTNIRLYSLLFVKWFFVILTGLFVVSSIYFTYILIKIFSSDKSNK